jgi:hypothetical protein
MSTLVTGKFTGGKIVLSSLRVYYPNFLSFGNGFIILDCTPQAPLTPHQNGCYEQIP